MTMTHFKQCPLCRTTFKGESAIELLETVRTHVETADHDLAGNEAKALNELEFQIEQARKREMMCRHDEDMILRESRLAFNNAITREVLSHKQGTPNYVGKFMYMYSKWGLDFFKHMDTRMYISVPFQ